MRLLLGVSRHVRRRTGAVEVGTERPGVGQAGMEVKLSVHVMVVVGSAQRGSCRCCWVPRSTSEFRVSLQGSPSASQLGKRM